MHPLHSTITIKQPPESRYNANFVCPPITHIPEWLCWILNEQGSHRKNTEKLGAEIIDCEILHSGSGTAIALKRSLSRNEGERASSLIQLAFSSYRIAFRLWKARNPVKE